MSKLSGIEVLNDLIRQECNDPKRYEQLLPLPVETLGRAAIKAATGIDVKNVSALIKKYKIPRYASK